MSQPIFHLLAGPNGAGKSTLYRAFVASGAIESDLELVNADLHERGCLQHIPDLQQRSDAAREWADARREALLRARAGFVSETVFSHESKLTLIRHAQSLGYQVVLYVVALDEPQRLLARVSRRVREGGHNVPAPHSGALERFRPDAQKSPSFPRRRESSPVLARPGALCAASGFPPARE